MVVIELCCVCRNGIMGGKMCYGLVGLQGNGADGTEYLYGQFNGIFCLSAMLRYDMI